MGDEIKVRVTYQDSRITNVEIVSENESEDVGKRALKVVPQEIVNANSIDVDAVTGATRTSKAIEEAVENALKNK